MTKRTSKKAITSINRNEDREFEKLLAEELQRQAGSHSGPYSADQIGIAMTHDFPSASSPSAQLQQRTDSEQSFGPPKPLTVNVTNATTSIQMNMQSLLNLPEPEYPRHLKYRHVRAILCRTWLFMSDLYRKASIFTEAHASVKSATAQVQAIEANISSREGHSTESMARRDFGSLKSCRELWADVQNEKATVLLAEDDIEGAYSSFEAALDDDPNHVGAAIGLSELLLDSYYAVSEEPSEAIPTLTAASKSSSKAGLITIADNLGRLGARDRAFGLLTAMTKAGRGWNNPRAWYALARAYEASEQGGKALKVYKWVLELEKGVRPSAEWSSLA